MQNPQTAMQHMFGNDPKFQQAMKMAQGKTPDQLKETAYPVYTRTGNLLRADQIRCRRVYPIIFGSDPNHFSMLCCVPNTVYTPTAPTVPTVEVLED